MQLVWDQLSSNFLARCYVHIKGTRRLYVHGNRRANMRMRITKLLGTIPFLQISFVCGFVALKGR
jgi:hypothetical protein